VEELSLKSYIKIVRDDIIFLHLLRGGRLLPQIKKVTGL
jgi:hypothetical protein